MSPSSSVLVAWSAGGFLLRLFVAVSRAAFVRIFTLNYLVKLITTKVAMVKFDRYLYVKQVLFYG